MIQVFSPSLGEAELLAVADSFNTGWIGKGPKVTEFEAAWARHIGVLPEQVVSTNSCTEALFTAVKLLDIGPGDEVIIPTIHFTGAAQAVIATGARPVFCDVDRRTLNATIEFAEAKLTNRTKGVILNHYGGVPCQDLEVFSDIYLIEDCACAPVSTYQNQPVGTWGDIGCWSFDAMKILSTGDGGMMAFKDIDLADKARRLLYLGVTPTGLDSQNERWWEFEVTHPGARRSIMNDLAAGVGLEQLKRLPRFIERREQLYKLYNSELANSSYWLPRDIPAYMMSSYYFYWIQTPRRNELAHYLREQGIYTTFRYYPLHMAYKTGDSLPNAEWAAQNTLLLPLHCNLTDEQVGYICDKIKDFYESTNRHS